MMFLTELRPLNESARAKKPANGAPAPVPSRGRPAAFQPALSLHETEDAYVIQAEVPGVDPETIELTLQKDELTLKGQKSLGSVEGARWHLLERTHGAFERTFQFPGAVDADGVTAEAHHGVLTIRVAKAKESLPRRIEVTAK